MLVFHNWLIYCVHISLLLHINIIYICIYYRNFICQQRKIKKNRVPKNKTPTLSLTVIIQYNFFGIQN